MWTGLRRDYTGRVDGSRACVVFAFVCAKIMTLDKRAPYVRQVLLAQSRMLVVLLVIGETTVLVRAQILHGFTLSLPLSRSTSSALMQRSECVETCVELTHIPGFKRGLHTRKATIGRLRYAAVTVP